MTRGLRNNNPGNIINSSVIFIGEVIPSADETFKQFQSMEYGYRALLSNLTHYIDTDGLTTISQIISKWAPPSENDTTAYINRVSQLTSIGSDKSIDSNDQQDMTKLAAAISFVENGQMANMTQINDAWGLFKRIEVAKTAGISLAALVFVASVSFIIYQKMKAKK